MKGFKVTGGKGFHLTFENGITISTQFGGGNYCDNHDYPITSMPYSTESQYKLEAETPTCPNAEIMIWIGKGSKEKDTITQEVVNKVLGRNTSGDTVEGYIEVEEWIQIINYLQEYKGEHHEAGSNN